MQYGGERSGRFHHMQGRWIITIRHCPCVFTWHYYTWWMRTECEYQITGCIDTLLQTLYPPTQSISWRRALRFFIGHCLLCIYCMWYISRVFPLPPHLHTGTDQILEAEKTWNEVIFNINQWLIVLHPGVCPGTRTTSVVQQLETCSYPLNWNHVQQA